MLPLRRQLSLLVHLSNADKDFASSERAYIHDIGKRNGLSNEEIEEIIEHPTGVGDLTNLPNDEKFDHMLSIIQLMKIDGRVRQSEIEFCEIMAMKLGYRPGVVAELSQHVYSDPKMNANLDELNRIADLYLLENYKGH
jgi:uncharacterized tellurite resistance protein B-like protein